MVEIKQWNDIKEKYKDSLILGNGASIAFSDKFNYKSLFEEAKILDLIKSPLEKIFNKFKTNDFEYVLNLLLKTMIVNESFGINDKEISAAYEEFSNVLIKIIKHIHPEYSSISEKLEVAGNFLKNFKNVFSLNYDLILYWIINLMNGKEPNRFKDCFIKGYDNCNGFEHDWGWLRDPYSNNSKTTLIFFLHGNLCLATLYDRENKIETEIKVKSQDNKNLLTEVTKKWREENCLPIFVCEGSSLLKEKSIKKNFYLSNVFYKAIPSIKDSLLVYGWSMGDEDEHILKNIGESSIMRNEKGEIIDQKLKTIAISVHEKNRDFANKVKIKVTNLLGDINIDFYDANSQGCWIY